jgi:hypothetical protein
LSISAAWRITSQSLELPMTIPTSGLLIIFFRYY